MISLGAGRATGQRKVMQEQKIINVRQGISSLELGLEVLELIADRDKPVSLTELSELADISPSRLHKYMVSLCKMGYIAQLENARYVISNSSLRLGMSALRRLNPVQVAFEYADKLHQELDKTVTVSIWNGNAPVVIKWLDGSDFVAVNVRLGTELSPFTSAAGRIFLAHLPTPRLTQMVDDFYQAPPALPRYMGQSLPKQAFLQLIDKIREEQLSIFEQDFLPDINVVSAPVFNIDGSINSVITLLGATNNTPVNYDEKFVQGVSKAAQNASRKIAGMALD